MNRLLQLCLTSAVLLGTLPAFAAPMGLGPDAREPIETWAGGLGLTVKSVTLTVDHAAIDLGGCQLLLAHDTGSRCSGLHMDAGGARACLLGGQCPPWPDFQKAILAAGTVHLPWHPVEMMPAAPSATGEGAADTTLPKGFDAALRMVHGALVVLDRQRATKLLSELLDREGLTLAQQLRFVPALAVLGLGADAFSRLGSGAWLSADMRLTIVVRTALQMGANAAVAVADAILGKRSACDAVGMGRAFRLAGDHAAAAALARVLRQKDVACFEAYALEVAAAFQAGQRQAVADTFHEARGRFPDDQRVSSLKLTALKATGQWRAAKYHLDQRLASKQTNPEDLAQLIDVLSRKPLKAEATIAWKTRLEKTPDDVVAAFVVGALAHGEEDHAGSFSLLTRAAQGSPGKVGRLHTLQALNAYSLGDIETAKAELRQAVALAPRDYHTHWAVAEVLRDTDLFVARRSIDIALGLIPHRALIGVRMKKQRAALAACEGSGTCNGPWRYRPGRPQ